MASKTIVLLEDDLDGSTEDVQTISLSYDGSSFEIDLSGPNREALNKALTPYLDAARRTGGRRKRTPTTTAVSSDTGTVRAWASANGYVVSSRGRIPADVREAFDAANK